MEQNTILCLIGTKGDLLDSIIVTKEEIDKFMVSNDIISYHKISSKTGCNIMEVFWIFTFVLYIEVILTFLYSGF